MQDDITWGVKYLIAAGIADPKHIGILGGSYGGYATLAGVTFTPDLYAAAVDIVGPSNLITLMESIPPYWEAGRKVFAMRMGDPSTEEGKKLLNERSPLNSADKIRTPLLVAQGANDPRVNRREAEQIVIALRDRGFPVEYILAPDEGHGFARPVNNLALFMESEKFLAQYLGGRAQSGGSPEAAARLKEISVDPKTVVITKKVDAASVSAPVPTLPLVTGEFQYAMKIAMGGQEIPMKLVLKVEPAGDQYKASTTMETPQGNVVISSALDKTTLATLSESVQQGPVTIDVNFADNHAKGKLSMGGQEHAIDTETGGPLFADGAGSDLVLGSLPLTENYTATYRNFDLQGQKVKLLQLKVGGTEKVTVPAGSFDAWRLEVVSADGGSDKKTVWIAKDSRKMVKSSTVAAAMGGAVITLELSK